MIVESQLNSRLRGPHDMKEIRSQAVIYGNGSAGTASWCLNLSVGRQLRTGVSWADGTDQVIECYTLGCGLGEM